MNDDNPRYGGRNLPSGTLSKILPYAIALAGVTAGLIIVAYLAGFFGTSAATPGADTSSQPGPSEPVAGGSLPPATESGATLETTNAPRDATGSWILDGVSGDVSPTSSLLAAVWTETVDNVEAGYGDLIVVSMGGPIAAGTQATSADLKLNFSLSRMDASGGEVFDYVFTSEAGECRVTMAPGGETLTGSFTCSGVPGSNAVDGSVVSTDATGTFALE